MPIIAPISMPSSPPCARSAAEMPPTGVVGACGGGAPTGGTEFELAVVQQERCTAVGRIMRSPSRLGRADIDPPAWPLPRAHPTYHVRGGADKSPQRPTALDA